MSRYDADNAGCIPTGHHPQQRWRRQCINGQQDAGVAHVTKLDRKAQPILRTAMLANKRQVGFIEGVQAD